MSIWAAEMNNASNKCKCGCHCVSNYMGCLMCSCKPLYGNQTYEPPLIQEILEDFEKRIETVEIDIQQLQQFENLMVKAPHPRVLQERIENIEKQNKYNHLNLCDACSRIEKIEDLIRDFIRSANGRIEKLQNIVGNGK
jgi:hypothetical protein